MTHSGSEGLPSPARARRPGWTAPWRVGRKLWAIAAATVRSQLEYLSEQLWRTLFLVIILYVFTQLWHATDRFQDVRVSTGFSIAQLIWYLAFTESIIMSSPGLRANAVDQEVRTGGVAYRLSKPIPYPLFWFGNDLGERAVRFLVHLFVGCIVALVVVGPIPLSLAGVLKALILVALGAVADWTWVFSISMLSLWVEDTFGLHLLYRRMLMLLGGMLLPLEAYPDWLEAICRKLPFAYLVYHPSRFFVAPEAAGWWKAVGMVSLIAAVGLVPLLLVYRIGLRRVSAQGG